MVIERMLILLLSTVADCQSVLAFAFWIWWNDLILPHIHIIPRNYMD